MADEQQKSREELEADWWAEWWKRDYSWEGLGEYLPDGTPKHPWEGWIVDGNGDVRENDGTEDEEYYLEHAKAGSWPRLATLQDYWRDQENDLIPDPASVNEAGVATRHFSIFHLPLHWQDGTPTGKAEWDEARRTVLNNLIGMKIQNSAQTEFIIWGRPKGPDRRVQFQGGVFLDFIVSGLHPPSEPDAEPEPIHLNWRSEFAVFSGEADFDSATFSGDAGFNSATFSGDADFDSATFSGYAGFNSATFSGYADFDSATFSGDAGFDSATFSGDAGFNSATFSGDARFNSATFSGDAGFYSATFSGDAAFNYVEFKGSGSFSDAVFAAQADFQEAELNSSIVFDGMRLAGPHRIARSAFLIMSGFVLGAALIGRLLTILPSPVGQWLCWGLFMALFVVSGRVGLFAARDVDDNLVSGQSSMRTLRKIAREALNHELEAIAHAAELKYSRLRWGKTWTQRLITKPAERVFSIAYEAFSDYGRSLIRPILWIIALIPIMASVYFLIDVPNRQSVCDESAVIRVLMSEPSSCDGADQDAMWQALDFSLANSFKPLSAISSASDQREQNPLAYRLLFDEDAISEANAPLIIDGPGLGIRVIAILQSLLSLILAFLCALAVRRRFQIN